MATRSKSSGSRKAGRSVKRGAARRGRTVKKASAKRSGTSRSASASLKRRPTVRKQSPVARVKRVSREVVQQATVAVSAGVETLRDLGESLVNRVRA